MLDIKYCFTCGDSDLSEIIKKCQNIITRIVWQFYFALYSSNDDSTFWKKYQFWLKIISLFRKQLIGKVESFPKSNFDLNQRKNSANKKPLNLELLMELDCFIFTSWLEKCFKVTENIKKSKFEGDYVNLRPKICSLRQS